MFGLSRPSLVGEGDAKVELNPQQDLPDSSRQVRLPSLGRYILGSLLHLSLLEFFRLSSEGFSWSVSGSPSWSSSTIQSIDRRLVDYLPSQSDRPFKSLKICSPSSSS